MKKQIALIFILLATIVCTISSASENSNLEENIKKLNEVQSHAAENRDTTKTVKGKVVLRFVVTKKGKAKEPIEIIESDPTGVFDEYALEIIKKWHFKPLLKKGVPVDGIVKLPLIFRITTSEFETLKETNEGIKFLKQNEYPKALSVFNKAIKIYPKYGWDYKLRGQTYGKLKDTEDMCIDLKKACELGDCTEFNNAKKAGKCSTDVTK